MVKPVDYRSYAILRGYNVSRSVPGNGLIIDEGDLSDMIKHALALPEREYYGMTIECEGKYLLRHDMVQMSQGPNFPV